MGISRGGGGGSLRSTSFLVYESGALLSCTICTTWRRSSSPSRCRPSASLSMSTWDSDHVRGVSIVILFFSEENESSLTLFSVRFFFLDPSSPAAARFDFTPFSSPGTGPDSRRRASRAGLGFLNVYTGERKLAQSMVFHRGPITHNDVLGFVTGLSKVQVVRNEMLLVGSSESYLHIELTPSFL